MIIEKYNILIDNFIEILIGYKLNLVSKEKILYLVEKGKIKRIKDNRIDELKELCLMPEKYFIDKIIQFSKEDDKSFNYNFESNIFEISEDYFRVWELEILLNIEEMRVSNEKKIDLIYEMFYKLNFPDRWALNNILRYSIKENNIMYSDDELIKNTSEYIKKEISFFQNR